eukprot:TRINITY_DN8917_c2_g1_i1.p1 TRINITY_DN8917_c2_g1~~TRINITY_DN8917_c2_g1_i1.p1  ORF type:complete len:453 (-),score=38.84 TRINITY_DN8917_c2_g1_i1:870-2228(-)
MQFHHRTLDEQSTMKERDIPLRQSPKKYVKESHGFIPAFRKPEQHSLAPGVQSVTPKFSGFHRVYLNMEQDEAQKAWKAAKEAHERQSHQDVENEVSGEELQRTYPLQTLSAISSNQNQGSKPNCSQTSDAQNLLQKQASGSLREYVVGVMEGSLHSQCPSIMEGQTYTSFLDAQNSHLNGNTSSHLDQKNKEIVQGNRRRNRARKNSDTKSESNKLDRRRRHADKSGRPQSACTEGICISHSDNNLVKCCATSHSHYRPNSANTDGTHDHYVLMSHNSENIGALSFDLASVSNYSFGDKEGSRQEGDFVLSHADMNDLKISRNRSVNLHQGDVISRSIDLNDIENLAKTQLSGEVTLIDVGAPAPESREVETRGDTSQKKANLKVDQGSSQRQRQSPSGGMGGLPSVILAHNSTVKKLEQMTIGKNPYAKKATMMRFTRCCFCTSTFKLVE